jgi:hypothetical protein
MVWCCWNDSRSATIFIDSLAIQKGGYGIHVSRTIFRGSSVLRVM